MWEPDQTEIPEGSNFIGWFDSGHSQQQLTRMFEAEGWRTQAVDGGYTLTKVVTIPAGRRTRSRSYEKTLALVTATPGHTNVLSGQLEDPGWMGREIRELLWRLEGQSNTLICRWRDHAGVWGETPASAEQLGLEPGSLSEADRTAVSRGYFCEPLTDVTQENLQPVHKKILFIHESVVIDDVGIRHYDSYRGVSRLNWDQIREVGAAGPDSGCTDTPILFITGDEVTLLIGQPAKGFSVLLDRLATLPAFPTKEFRRLLDKSMPVGEEVVWRRGFPQS